MPLPAVANVIVPGFAFASAMYSLQIVDRHRRIDDEHVRIAGDERHRRQVLHRVERDLALVQRRVRREVVRLHDQRVAVRRRAHHLLRRDERVAAGLVVDDDLLSHVLRHLLRHDAREEVGAAAGRERHEQLDGLVGIGALRGRVKHRPGEQRCPPTAIVSFGNFTASSFMSWFVTPSPPAAARPCSMIRYRNRYSLGS